MVARLKNNNQPSLQKNVARSPVPHFEVSGKNCFSNFEGFKSIFFHFKKIKDIMRTPKNWLLAAFVVTSTVLYYSFNCSTSGAHLTVTDTISGAQFTLHDLPDYSHLDSDGDGRFLVFVNTGDGNYIFRETVTYAQVKAAETQGCSIVLNTYHKYKPLSSGSYKPYAELTPAYGDTDPPPLRIAGISGGTVSFAPTNTFTAFNGCTFNGWVKIEANRKIVSGDSITYMVTYQNRDAAGGGICSGEVSGNITITYDGGKLTPRGTETFFGETPNSTSGNTVSYHYTGLQAGSQRTIFFIFEANDNLTLNDPLNPITKVDFSYERHGADEPCNSSTSVPHPASSQVADAHDPNEKNVLHNGLCNSDDLVKWRVDFQNEGNAAETSVTIVDWIDTLLDLNTVQLTGSKFTVNAPIWDRPKREVRFTMDNITLRGLREGVDEELTRGYITLSAKKRSGVNMPCNAVVNRARIHFKCKPPILTEDAIAPFACDSLCTPCTVVFDTTLTAKVLDTVITLFSASDQSSALYSLLSSAQYVKKWYPSDGLSNPLVLNPTVVKPYKRIYTLIASSANASTITPCQRIIVRVPVKPATELKMFPLAVSTSGCPDHPLWKVTAQAFGASSAANLIWHDCTAGTDAWTSSSTNLGPYQTVYVGVWDTETECTDEAWIPLEAECITIDGCRNYRYSVAIFAVAILGFLLYRIFKKVKLAGK